MSTQTHNARSVVAIVGASGGIGRALLESYADSEVDLYLTANRGRDALAESLSGTKLDERVREIFQVDLADAQGAPNFADALLERLRKDQNEETPRLDALVVAAGIDLMTPESKALPFDRRLAKAWQIDVASTISIARALGKAMAERKRAAKEQDYAPSVVLFGWDGVGRGQEGDTAQIYSACKGAIVAFAKSLAQDLAPCVRVNTISPGWIKTAWGAEASRQAVERVMSESLSQRWGRADEVANVVRFLLSDAASYLDGQDVPLNGGFSYLRRR